MAPKLIHIVACAALGLAPLGMASASHQYDPQYDDRDQNQDRYERAERYGGHGRLSDRAIHDRVHRALERQLGDDARGISVTVRDQNVILAGTVPTSRARRAAHDIAHSVYGVNSVYHDRLYVDRY